MPTKNWGSFCAPQLGMLEFITEPLKDVCQKSTVPLRTKERERDDFPHPKVDRYYTLIIPLYYCCINNFIRMHISLNFL